MHVKHARATFGLNKYKGILWHWLDTILSY